MTAIHGLFATFYLFYLFYFAFWELREDPHPSAIFCQKGHHLICEGGMGRRVQGVYLLGWVASSWVVAFFSPLSLLLSLFSFSFRFSRDQRRRCVVCLPRLTFHLPQSMGGGTWGLEVLLWRISQEGGGWWEEGGKRDLR